MYSSVEFKSVNFIYVFSHVKKQYFLKSKLVSNSWKKTIINEPFWQLFCFSCIKIAKKMQWIYSKCFLLYFLVKSLKCGLKKLLLKQN